jgi:hypothetical protein
MSPLPTLYDLMTLISYLSNCAGKTSDGIDFASPAWPHLMV